MKYQIYLNKECSKVIEDMSKVGNIKPNTLIKLCMEKSIEILKKGGAQDGTIKREISRLRNGNKCREKNK